ncbi:MAG: hypothetical protein QSU88_06100 [Candidatus Methanoperedens sp.]|nr:hypothetical protein [Candidatus Methanoperedens sp.]
MWYDLVPVFGVVVTIVGISFKAGQILQKQNHVIGEVGELKTEMREVKTDIRRIDDLDKRISILETPIAMYHTFDRRNLNFWILSIRIKISSIEYGKQCGL